AGGWRGDRRSAGHRRRLAPGAVPRAASAAVDPGARGGGSRVLRLPCGMPRGDGRSRGDAGRAVRVPGPRDGLPRPGTEAVRPRLLEPGRRATSPSGELERARPRPRASLYDTPTNERRAPGDRPPRGDPG